MTDYRVEWRDSSLFPVSRISHDTRRQWGSLYPILEGEVVRVHQQPGSIVFVAYDCLLPVLLLFLL